MKKKQDSNNLTDKELAQIVINSKGKAEDFIEQWMLRHNTSREDALKRLRQLGIELTKLPQEN